MGKGTVISMLLQFSVENFMSFKEQSVLCMEPSRDSEHKENIIKKGSFCGLKFAVTYGANAAGKSCFFKAITMALLMVRSSNLRQVGDTLGVNPFKFSEDCVNKPSKFEFQFLAGDGKKYIYGFSADPFRVHEEYLFCYSSRRPTKVFVRHSDGSYEFTAREKNILMPLTQWNTPNKFFVATATMWNAQSTKPAMEWLSKGIDTYTDLSTLTQDSLQKYQSADAAKYTEFASKLMNNAGINISRIDVHTKKIPVDANMLPFIPSLIVNGQVHPFEQTQTEVKTFHDVSGADGVKKRIGLNLSEESQGTQLLFAFSPILQTVLNEGKAIIIDEIDRSLHPEVVKYIVGLFRNPKTNPHGAQLIATTHNTSLLSLTLLRRDQVFFVEKDKNTGESCLYPMTDCPVRKHENIEKGYLQGRYGAAPTIREGELP
jgi:AAA15 family ATPase/GTPase